MIKKLTENDVRRIAGVSGKQYKKVQWHTATIVVKQFLTLKEYLQTIGRIVENCRTKDGQIASGLLDFSIRVNVISSYAFVEFPQDIDELFYIVYGTDLYDKVCSVANASQIQSIEKIVSFIANTEGVI